MPNDSNSTIIHAVDAILGIDLHGDMQMALPTCNVAKIVQKEPGLFLCLNQDDVIAQVRHMYAAQATVPPIGKDEYFAIFPRMLFDAEL